MRVILEQGEAGLLHATSPDMPELLVSGETEAEVQEAVPAVVAALCQAAGVAMANADRRSQIVFNDRH